MSIVKFSEVAHRAYTREDRFNTEKIYYVGGEHIDSCELYVTKKGVIKGSTIGPMFYCGFTAGQILFVTRNPHLKKCSIADFDGICSEKTFVIETKDESILTQEYLAIIMQSDDFWNYCEENKSGGVNYFLNWSTLADYEFELPPIKQQLEIAQKVMSAYRLKQSYKKLLDATREMVKSQFIEMFGNQNTNDKGWTESLVKDEFKEKEFYVSGMKKEIDRCEKVLELAKEGKSVALISSGDAGIYGMAGIMIEVAADSGIDVEVIPGITASVAGAALVGAPIMHDQAVISLSDLLTDWDVITKRIDKASEGDFVISLYNPKSNGRTTQIVEAREIMLRHKAPTTPVALLKHVGREDQNYTLTDLEHFLEHEIDMFTVVIIGNSKSYVKDNRMITPRGYKL